MPPTSTQNFSEIWQARGMDALSYVLKRWYLLVLAAVIAGAVGYLKIRKVKPVFTATISFVLSTDQKERNAFAGLASQMGFDGLSSGADNIFSGDNIIEFFKSRKLIGSALQSIIDSNTHQTLLNYIAQSNHAQVYKKLGAFGQNPAIYNAAQNKLYRNIISETGKSFMVFKKDKKLIFYLISTQSTNPKIAYYVSRCVLSQTASYFITTKTNVAATSVKLLQHEADSIAYVLRNIYSATASMNDQTYNLNPSISVQRSGSMYNQARVAAFSAAYSEVMRSLEIAKINLQKETPLYRIIDEPELPLIPVKESILKYMLLASFIGLIFMAMVLAGLNLYQSIRIK